MRHTGGTGGQGVRGDGGIGSNVVSSSGASGGHCRVLRAGGENWSHVDDHPSRSLGNALYDWRTGARHARRFHLRRCRSYRETDSGETRAGLTNSLLLALRLAGTYGLWRRPIHRPGPDFIVRRRVSRDRLARPFHFRALTVAHVTAFLHVPLVGELRAPALSEVRTTG